MSKDNLVCSRQSADALTLRKHAILFFAYCRFCGESHVVKKLDGLCCSYYIYYWCRSHSEQRITQNRVTHVGGRDPYLIFCNNYYVDFLDMDEVQLMLWGQLTLAIQSVLPWHEMCICFRVTQSITLRSCLFIIPFLSYWFHHVCNSGEIRCNQFRRSHLLLRSMFPLSRFTKWALMVFLKSHVKEKRQKSWISFESELCR